MNPTKKPQCTNIVNILSALLFIFVIANILLIINKDERNIGLN
jgi:hypothetical protein